MENDQNTEKCPGDLRRLAVTQTPAKNSQGVNNNNSQGLHPRDGVDRLYEPRKKKRKTHQH